MVNRNPFRPDVRAEFGERDFVLLGVVVEPSLEDFALFAARAGFHNMERINDGGEIE
jgi:hypothetical protein